MTLCSYFIHTHINLGFNKVWLGFRLTLAPEILTRAQSCLTSTNSWADQASIVVLVMAWIWLRSSPLRLSEPMWFKIKYRRCLWMYPVAFVLTSKSGVSWPTSLEKESKYHVSTDFPSWRRTNLLNSGSVDTTTGRPAKLVLNKVPYLKKKILKEWSLNIETRTNNNNRNIKLQDKSMIWIYWCTF